MGIALKNKYNLIDCLKIMYYCIKTTDNEDTGKILENDIANTLKGLAGVRVYRNVIIPINGRDISTTELDLVVIFNNHAYIIEAKNYNGKVLGNGEDTNWNVKYNSGREYRVYNPLMQQRGHIKNLAKLLNVPESCIGSIVCFSNNSDLSELNLNRRNRGEVTNINYLLATIQYQERLNMKFNRCGITPIQIDTLEKCCRFNRLKRAVHKHEMKSHFNR